MKLVAKVLYSNRKDRQTKISFNDGLTFNVELIYFLEEVVEVRLFRSRKYKWQAFRSQNHERAALELIESAIDVQEELADA